MVTIIDKAQNSNSTTFSSNGTYTPAKGMNYRWTGGSNYSLVTSYKYEVTTKGFFEAPGEAIKNLFSDWDKLTAEEWNKHYRSKSVATVLESSYTPYSTGDALKKNGVYITKGIDTPYFTINSQRRTEPIIEISNRHKSGSATFWTETQKGTVTSTYSMKADNPIDIKFVTGNSAVDLTSKGGINNTTVNARALSLRNDYANSGDIDVTYNPIGTGALNIAARNQNTVVNANGAVNLTISEVVGKNITLNATEDITGKNNGRLDTLNLNSSKGKIDFKIESDSQTQSISKALNATALKDININSTSTKDLTIGTIESKTGNVTIATQGNLVSAITEKQNPTTSTQIENRKNADILNTWSQKELVNALNGNIFSKDPYTVDLAPVANITADRVTLNIGGNIGSKGTAKTISYSNLNSEENLKLLANARVGDLEWGSNSVTYTPHNPIGLTLRVNGTNRQDWNLNLSGTADDDINLAAADNKTSFNLRYPAGKKHFSVGNENADVTLIAAAGIIGGDNRISAKNLTLRGGNGDINVMYNYTGYLDAITGGNLTLSQPRGPITPQDIMYVRNAIAGGNLNLYGLGTNFYRADDNAYISAGTRERIYIEAKSPGTNSTNFLNILANGIDLIVKPNSSSNPLYLNAITRDGLQNKIYFTLNKPAADLPDNFRKVYFSPDNVFETRR